ATLRAERAHRGALDKTAVGDADNATLVNDQILHIDLAFVASEIGQAIRTVLISNFAEFLFDNRQDAFLFRQNVAQILNRVDQFLVFGNDLVPLHPGELVEAKLQDLIGLVFAERVTPVDQTRLVPNENADFLHLLFRKLERKQLDPRLISIARFADN